MFLFAIYLAEISYVATSFENPLYAEEMNILDFLKQPDVTIIQALLLKFKPANMDVLPLYIILLLLFPPILWLLQLRPTLALGASVAALRADLGVRLEPAELSERPLVLQSVRLATAVRVRRLVRAGGSPAPFAVLQSRVTLAIAVAYLLFAFVISLTWYLPADEPSTSRTGSRR